MEKIAYAPLVEKIDFLPCLADIREIASSKIPTIIKVCRLSDKIVDNFRGDYGWHRSKYARLRLDLSDGTFVDKEFRIDKNCSKDVQVRSLAALTAYASRELLGRKLSDVEWIVKRLQDMVIDEE